MDSKLTEVSADKLLRREWIVASIAVASSLVWSTAKSTWAKPKDKSDALATGLFRVRSVLDINGEIRLRSQTNDATSKGGKVIAAKTAPIKASSTVDFDEQFETSGQLILCRSYQHYHESTSEIQIDRHVTKTSLREQCRDILRIGTEQGFMAACPQGPATRFTKNN